MTSSPDSNSSPANSDEQQEELVELTPATEDGLVPLSPVTQPNVASPPTGFRVALVAGSFASFTSETTSLLHSRLCAVTVLFILIFSILLIWTLANPDVDLFRNATILRLVILAVLLVVLYYRGDYTQSALRGMEYSLFGVLTLVWMYSRYHDIMLNAQAGDITNLLVDSRTSMIGLFLLIIVHGIFIPHHWWGTAKVALTMALAPMVALIFVRALNHDAVWMSNVGEMLEPTHVSLNIVIVVVGAVLATYSSGVLNAMRAEVHQAKRFGQYQLAKKLGSGGMGDVYLAEHALMKRPCALKLIRPESSTDPTVLARFEREVQSTAQLTHPNTIEIYDYGRTDDGTFYYVMELLPGLSLAELIEQSGPLSAGRTIFLLRQACSALAEAHATGMVHRDLKPGNLFISERGGLCDFVKVLDFGLVKLTHDPRAVQLTMDQTISGTPHYMAPEQAMGERGLDPRCDVYALGAVAYHMLTGRPPFEGETPVAVMVGHASLDVVRPSKLVPEIPEDLERVVLRCLEKNADDRYDDALALEEALGACSAASEWNGQQAALWWEAIASEADPPTAT